MSGTYKTPGVYVEEISKFPPSVAEVETAIPAFIGYTDRATKVVENDLRNVPTRISSLLEYEQLFGTGPVYSSLSIKLNASNIPVENDTSIANSKFHLYDSIRLFYDNGGGSCYIVSVGGYGSEIELGDNSTGLKGGLEQLKKYDEPTLILFPDAVNLSADKLGILQQAALQLCSRLGDRFVIMDVKDSAAGNTLLNDLETFRNNVGMNHLKYGSAYHPYLNTVYTKKFRFRNINPNITKEGNPRTLKELMKDSDVDENGVKIKDRLVQLENLVTDNNNIAAGITSFIGAQTGGDSLAAIFRSKKTDFENAATPANKTTRIKAIFNFLWEALLNIDGMLANNAADPKVFTKLITNTQFLTSATGFISSSVKNAMQELVNLDNEAFNPTNDLSNSANTYSAIAASFKSATLSGLAAAASNYMVAADADGRFTEALKKIEELFTVIKEGIESVEQMGIAYEETHEKSIIPYIPFYKGILNTLNSKITTIPPSGAIAGIYAITDRERGVWKAPANLSISSVNGVSEFIDDSIQENMNVDVNAGKSINAIRPFSGKGILVWGARTLAGNDNEWRYIPVRRFYNFVEESTKKSTSWVVFEPNDANTWVRVKGQIENFLNNLWRRGALAGAKPEHAYYVNVGLGITMTQQDILDGKLIVEIGMAVVRPAEFIILRFSHKLQES